MYETLIGKAAEAREKSFCKYSGFAVGAALLCSDGTVFTGCNIENISYSLT
ncbi:MAG: cytidine deaminase, partial [Oscillospiraceae bacterium]|nr:cytidine deaminase [Oscillospiraceae bacterium]